MSKKKHISSVKLIALSSTIGMVAVLAIMFVSRWLNYEGVFGFSALLYMAISLVLSVAVFILLLRRYQIAPNHDLAIRGLAISGAMVCACIWFALIYPVIRLLS